MDIGSFVNGIDLRGNNVNGVVENIIKIANVAIIRISEDKLGITECYLENIKEKNT